MAKLAKDVNKENKNYIVDPLDADYAISVIQEALQEQGMSTTDLSVELKWNVERVEELLNGEFLPTFSSLKAMADVLNIELEFSEE